MADDLSRALARSVRGTVLAPGDEGFDAARSLWNARLHPRPSLLVRCSDANDVAATVRFAAGRDLPVSARGGGHDFAGGSMRDGAIGLDLSALAAIEVDAGARRARVGGGARWAGVDRATQACGLVTPGATVSTVGVGGFTLGGGQGHLSRLHGLACDNLAAVELVLADGRRLRTSETEYPDLFWAVRGGGGHFGVVTCFEFRLHPLATPVLAGQIVHRYEEAAPVLRRWRDIMAEAPDALQCWAFLMRLPPVEGVPRALHGTPVLDLLAVHATPGKDQAALDALRACGTPLMDTVAPVDYMVLQQAFDAGMAGGGRRWYSRAHYLDALPDTAIDTLLAHAAELPGQFTTVYLGAEGGAAGRVPADARAFPHRDAAFSLHAFPGWTDPADDGAMMEWTRSLHAAMAPFARGGVYLNLLAEDEGARRAAAWGANLPRLLRIKQAWDGTGRFPPLLP